MGKEGIVIKPGGIYRPIESQQMPHNQDALVDSEAPIAIDIHKS